MRRGMSRVIVAAACLLLIAAASSHAQSPTVPNADSGNKRPLPAEFVSDGCTGFPDCNYRDCCVEHDRDYYFGGTSKERWSSDKRLYKCVRSKPGWQNKLIAPLMWVGVRVGGVSFLPTPFRWGFGKTKKPRRKAPAVKYQKKIPS
jgi:hypothetical protein